MNPATVDLNLLRALHALLEERTVTGAAKRMGISQPSMSASLARLRRYFNDELLVRNGREHRLTPLARHLQKHTRMALRAADRVFESQPEFDPANSKRQFRIIASDYDTAMVVPRLTDLLAREAPRADLAVTTITSRDVEGCPETLLDCDLLILPHGMITDAASQEIFRDEWQCVVATDNPTVGDRLTVEQLESSPWVIAYETATSTTTIARALRTLGINLNVQMKVESFLLIPDLVAGTDRISVLPRRMVERFPDDCGIRSLPCPLGTVPLVEAMWWHPLHDGDSEHAFLRALVRKATAPLRVPERECDTGFLEGATAESTPRL